MGQRAHDPEEVARLADQGLNNSEIAAKLGISEAAVRRSLAKIGYRREQPPEEITLDIDRLGEIAALLRRRGLDPDDWVIIRAVINEWEGFYKRADKNSHTVVPQKQLKVTLRPRLDLLLRPAVQTSSRPLATLGKTKPPSNIKPRLVVFVGDEQAPYHDTELHALFLRWLAHNQPQEAVHLGDLLDLPTLSRHRPNPVWNAGPQECINAGYRILRGYREASPGTYWRALPGNHDERLRDYQLQRAPELFGIKAADLDGRELAAVHSLPSLLHFDALGIEWVGSDGDYEHAQVDLTDSLCARHGFITGANSAQKTLDKLGLNVVVGHTHRQVVTYVTEERRRETLVTMCVEAGAMCKRDGGLGYVVNPNWQNGFYAANVWPDGTFSGEHARYQDGVLTWRDQRYEARASRVSERAS